MVSRPAASRPALQAAATDRLRAHYEAELGSARQELERQGQLRQQAALEQQQDARRHQMTLQSQCACALRWPPSLRTSSHAFCQNVGLSGLGCGWNLAVAEPPPPPPPPGPCVCVRRLEVQRRQFAAREADAAGALQSEMEAVQAAAAATSASQREELSRLRARCGSHEQLLEASRMCCCALQWLHSAWLGGGWSTGAGRLPGRQWWPVVAAVCVGTADLVLVSLCTHGCRRRRARRGHRRAGAAAQARARGESFLRVHWVAVPEAVRARRVNVDVDVVNRRRCGARVRSRSTARGWCRRWASAPRRWAVRRAGGARSCSWRSASAAGPRSCGCSWR
eukprot:COSAG01_NODE_7000_length_3398_cov_4.180964_3_plen_337_part_00